MKRLLALLILATPLHAEIPQAATGLYAPPLQPAALCPMGHYRLYPDGRLLGVGTVVKPGYLCRDGGEALDCYEGEMDGAVLHVPRRDGTAPRTRMLPVPEEGVLLWDVDGRLPKPMERCPAFTPLMPELTLADDAPAAVVDEAALEAAGGAVIATAGQPGAGTPGAFPVTGIFGLVPESPLLLKALDTLAAPEGSVEEKERQTAEGLLGAACAPPYALGADGRMTTFLVVQGVLRAKDVLGCAPEEGRLTCRYHAKRNGQFIADPEGRQALVRIDTTQEPARLCREDAGVCTVMVPCPEAMADMPVEGLAPGATLGSLVQP